MVPRWSLSASFASQPASPNETPSAANACSICSAVSASEKGRLSLCNRDCRTRSYDLAEPPRAGVKDLRPSLIQLGGQTQGRSHAERMMGQNGLNAQPGSQSSQGGCITAHPPGHDSRACVPPLRGQHFHDRERPATLVPGECCSPVLSFQHHPTQAIRGAASASAIAVNPRTGSDSAIRFRHLCLCLACPSEQPRFFYSTFGSSFSDTIRDTKTQTKRATANKSDDGSGMQFTPTATVSVKTA